MLKYLFRAGLLALGIFLAACVQPGGTNPDDGLDKPNDSDNPENPGDPDNPENPDNPPDLPEGWEDWEEDPEAPLPEVIGIEIAAKPDTIIYPNNFAEKGGLDWTGLVVNKVWDNGMTEKMDRNEYTIDDSKVSATYGFTTSPRVIVKRGEFEADFTVVIDKSNRVLTGVTYTGLPSAVNELGNPFDFDNLVITGNYSDSTMEKVANNACTITGYDMRKRGAQSVTLKVNGKLVGTFSVTTKVPESATIVITPPVKGQYKPGQTTGFRPAYLKGERYDPKNDAGLAVKVTVNGQTIPLTFANGGLTMADLAAGANTAFGADYRFTTKGPHTIRFKLDDATASYDVFVMDSPGTQPRVFFDYGYRQTATDLRGEGYGDGKYYVKAGSELVLAPVLFLIGYKADYTPDTVSYAWSVTGGSYDTSKPHNGETFTFKPTATPTTYTVKVTVTGRNVITGLPDTKSA
jgi:hypothetical protein